MITPRVSSASRSFHVALIDFFLEKKWRCKFQYLCQNALTGMGFEEEKGHDHASQSTLNSTATEPSPTYQVGHEWQFEQAREGIIGSKDGRRMGATE